MLKIYLLVVSGCISQVHRYMFFVIAYALLVVLFLHTCPWKHRHYSWSVLLLCDRWVGLVGFCSDQLQILSWTFWFCSSQLLTRNIFMDRCNWFTCLWFIFALVLAESSRPIWKTHVVRMYLFIFISRSEISRSTWSIRRLWSNTPKSYVLVTKFISK